jgi:[ribosomal protein S18]-alanine N-acetyltransferase
MREGEEQRSRGAEEQGDSPSPPHLRSSAPAPLVLRGVLPSDFEQLYQLDQVCFEPGVAYSRDELRRFLSMSSCEGVVAEAERRVVGFAIGYLSRGKVAHVVTLDVDPGRRREGLGRDLLENLLGRFVAHGARRARLEVSTENRGAIAFYEELGFARLGTIRDYYSPGADAFEMEKPLS